MSSRAVGRFVWTVIVFSPFSCTNAPPAGYGFVDYGSSDDGGGPGDAAAGTSHAQTGTTGQQNTPAAGPAQTNSNEAGASQPTTRDGGSGRPGAGSSQADASASTVDASTVDASTADASTADSAMVTGDGGPCVQNLGCMLSPPASTGDIRQDCVDRINQFRTQCACLPALQRWTAGEACADQEAQYDSQQMSGHAGFIATETACSQGSSMWAACCSTGAFAMPLANAQDECPGYPSNDLVISTCLQQMWSEGPPPNGVQACMADNACFQMHGHFINMSSTQDTKVACGFYTTPSGAIWATQNFAP
jgi:hypothetical protein